MLSTQEINAVSICADIVSTLSLLGSASILIAYYRYTTLRKFSFTLVAFLSMSDLFNHIADVVGPTASELEAQRLGAPLSNTCYMQAFGNAIFELSSVLFTGAIAATLYAQVMLGWRQARIESNFFRILAFCYLLPLFLFFLPLTISGPSFVGPSGGSWCWIRPQFVGYIFGLFYVPVWIVMIFNGIVHYKTSRYLSKLIHGESGGGSSTTSSGVTSIVTTTTDPATTARLLLVMQRLKYYPYILLIVWLPASISRIVEAINGGESFFLLVLFHRIFSSSQGLLNAIAYGLSRGVREAISQDLYHFFPSCTCFSTNNRHVELTLSSADIELNATKFSSTTSTTITTTS